MIFKAAGIAVHSIAGALRLRQAQRIDWSERLSQLSNPVKWYDALKDQQSSGFAYQVHVDNLGRIAGNVAAYPKPKAVYQLIVIAAYNEPYEVIQPTLQSLVDSTYDSKHMIIVFGYEERGGTSIEQTVKRLQKEYKSSFYACA